MWGAVAGPTPSEKWALRLGVMMEGGRVGPPSRCVMGRSRQRSLAAASPGHTWHKITPTEHQHSCLDIIHECK